MSMTPKQEWIFMFGKVLCRKCGRHKRIFDRLQKEIDDNHTDEEKDRIAENILKEEA